MWVSWSWQRCPFLLRPHLVARTLVPSRRELLLQGKGAGGPGSLPAFFAPGRVPFAVPSWQEARCLSRRQQLSPDCLKQAGRRMTQPRESWSTDLILRSGQTPCVARCLTERFAVRGEESLGPLCLSFPQPWDKGQAQASVISGPSPLASAKRWNPVYLQISDVGDKPNVPRCWFPRVCSGALSFCRRPSSWERFCPPETSYSRRVTCQPDWVLHLRSRTRATRLPTPWRGTVLVASGSEVS